MFQPGEAENQIPRGNSYDCNIEGGCEEIMRAKLPNSTPYGDDGGFRGRDGTNKQQLSGTTPLPSPKHNPLDRYHHYEISTSYNL